MADSDLQRELEQLREQNRQTAVSATVRSAIDGIPGLDLHAGAAGQITELLRHEIALVPLGNGQSMAVGPGSIPAAQHIKARLESPEYAHFRKSNTATAPAPGQPRGPQPGPLLPAADDPTATLGVRVIHATLAARQAAGGGSSDPRVNPSLPMGLKLPTSR